MATTDTADTQSMNGAVAPAQRLHATFVMEQHLGHRTFYENLRRHVDTDPAVAATWVEVAYAPATARWERLPGISPQLRGTLRGRREVSRERRSRPADVTFFNTQVPAVIAGRRSRKQPYVLCTDITPTQYDRVAHAYGHVPDAAGVVARAKHAWNRSVFQAAAATVAWSTWTRASLIRDYGLNPGRIAVIPPGVDTGVWSPLRDANDGPLRILFVGGDLHRKGGGALLSAFERMPPGSAELTLVTRTPYPAGNGVHVEAGMAPNSPELIELFRTSDVFVLPSEAEAFGIAAAEAAAAGLPVVATKVGGLTDIVVDGETGFLVAPGDADALADRLLRLDENPRLRRRMGAAGRERALARFDAGRNAARIVALLREVATTASG